MKEAKRKYEVGDYVEIVYKCSMYGQYAQVIKVAKNYRIRLLSNGREETFSRDTSLKYASRQLEIFV